MNPLEDPRVQADTYIVRPTCFDDIPEYERHNFYLVVTNGHSWGWSVRQHVEDRRAMNKKGKFIWESRGSGHNKARRWPLEEALDLALKFVDRRTVNGRTAQEWVDFWNKSSS